METKLTAPDAEYEDEFGRAVAVQGNVAVVGAPKDQGAGYGTGAAYVFEKTTSGWQLQQKLTAPDSSSYSFFGTSVAIDGDRIVVGAYGDQNAGIYAGAAYVFVRAGSQWTPEQKLTGSENSFADSFGISVAIKGDRIICGAFGNSDFNQGEVGSAYVFQRIDGLWLQQQELTASDGASLARFGLSVAMSEDTIAVGADGDSELGFFSGAVYVFTFDGSNWLQQQKLHAQDAREGASFGYHVAMSGDTIVAGAPGDEVGTHTHGAAYVFSRRSHGWLQDRKLIAKDKDVFDGFGLRVAVSEDTIAVGSMFDIEAALYAGAVYVYKRKGNSGWSLHEKLFASDAARDDAFGCAVAASNNTVLIGAFGKSDIAFYAGAAYVYEF
ncbi:MAG TPA: FG-GAP repeat protein [Pyrinomonadaceae bacterium]|nr:FG-GAP repeat protein [Pyrinomonadaceae bacterium]